MPPKKERALPPYMQHDWVTKYVPTQTLHEQLMSDAQRLHVDQPVSSSAHRYIGALCLHQTLSSDTYVVMQPRDLDRSIPLVTGHYRTCEGGKTLVPVTLNWLLQRDHTTFHRVQEIYDEQGQLISTRIWYLDSRLTEGPSHVNYVLMRQPDGTFKKTLWHASSTISQFVEASPALRTQTLETDFEKTVQDFRTVAIKQYASYHSSYEDTKGSRLSLNEWQGRFVHFQQTRNPMAGYVILVSCLVLVYLNSTYFTIGSSLVFSISKLFNTSLQERANQWTKWTTQLLYQAAYFVTGRPLADAPKTDISLTLGVYDGTFRHPLRPLFYGAGKREAYLPIHPLSRVAINPGVGNIVELQRGVHLHRLQCYTMQGHFNHNHLVGAVTLTYDGKQWHFRNGDDGKIQRGVVGRIYLLPNLVKPFAFDIQLTGDEHYCCQFEKTILFFINHQACDALTFFTRLQQHGDAVLHFIKQIYQELTVEQVQSLINLIKPEWRRKIEGPKPVVVAIDTADAVHVADRVEEVLRREDDTSPVETASSAVSFNPIEGEEDLDRATQAIMLLRLQQLQAANKPQAVAVPRFFQKPRPQDKPPATVAQAHPARSVVVAAKPTVVARPSQPKPKEVKPPQRAVVKRPPAAVPPSKGMVGNDWDNHHRPAFFPPLPAPAPAAAAEPVPADAPRTWVHNPYSFTEVRKWL